MIFTNPSHNTDSSISSFGKSNQLSLTTLHHTKYIFLPIMLTLYPNRLSWRAAARPAAPAPMTSTDSRVCIARGNGIVPRIPVLT